MNLSTLSTFELAKKANCRITDLRRKPTKEGAFYFCKLDGQEMKASEAHKLLLARLNNPQNIIDTQSTP